jgi:hypothetical protein
VRWCQIGFAIAVRTRSGTGVGPGDKRRYFILFVLR